MSGLPRDQWGMTLVELLLAMLIMVGVMAVLTLLLASGLDIWEAGTVSARVDDEGRVAVERLGRELRASDGGAGLISIGGGGTSISFPLDNDNDGAYETTVEYYLDGTVLRRRENGLPAVGDPVVREVTDVEFADPFGNMDLVTFSLQVAGPREGLKGVAGLRVRSAVGPRNN